MKKTKIKDRHKKKMDKKWKSLKARGYKSPKDSEENARRLKEARKRV